MSVEETAGFAETKLAASDPTEDPAYPNTVKGVEDGMLVDTIPEITPLPSIERPYVGDRPDKSKDVTDVPLYVTL